MTITARPELDAMPAGSTGTRLDRLRARDTDPSFAEAPVLDVYGRISRNPETGETEKVDRQVDDCLAEVERRGARLGEVLRDDGISAWSVKAKRPGWSRLVARLEDGHANGVVAWHTDRLMRQPRDLERLVDLGSRGVLVASCHGNYALDNADDRFTLRVLTAAAAKESDSTSRRFKRKAQAMRDNGVKSGGPRAFGEYGKPPAGVDADEHRAKVDAERDAIRWAVQAHLDGTSQQTIADEWNRRELTTIYGHRWEARTTTPVLKAPRLAGLLAHKGVVVGRIADYEPIVTEAQHHELVAVFASRRRGRPVSDPYLLSGGHLLCELCGQRLTGKTSDKVRADGVPRRQYVCRKRGEGCGRLSIDVARAEDAVRGLVVRQLSDPRHVGQLARQSAKLAEAMSRLAKAQSTATELSRRLGEGQLSLDRYDAAVAPLDARIQALTAEVAGLRSAGAGTEARRTSAAEVARRWDAGTVDGRRQMVRRVAPTGLIVLKATPAQHGSTSDATARLKVRRGR